MAKNQLKGKVVSKKMKETVVVEVEQIKKNKKYKRRYSYLKNFKVHDQKGECNVGDEVLIEECRPISKDKKWRIIKIIRGSSQNESAEKGNDEIFEEPIIEKNSENKEEDFKGEEKIKEE